MKNIFNLIPGFRSGKIYKKIIASIYYLMVLLMATVGESIPVALMTLSLPFVVLGLLDKLNAKLKKEKQMIKVNLLPFGLILLFSSPIIFNLTQQNNTEVKEAKSVSIAVGKNIQTKHKNKENKNTDEIESDIKTEQNNKTNSSDVEITTKTLGRLIVHYIDVGQADSILIQQGENSMLIDAGNNGDSDLVVNYLKKQGISKLEYVIGTHSHEDHIGGLDVVINSFEIGKVLMPKATSTTKTFKDVVAAIKNKGLKITTPNVGDEYTLGKANWTILAPNGNDYADVNNYSIIAKLKFGNNSFIFEGDAEDISEGQILAKQLDIQSDVIKIGHHGSESSTTESYLNKIAPKYAVISVGKDNKYGHPDKIVMDRLKAKGIEVYRTDESGTIICTSDGDKIEFNTDPDSYKYVVANNNEKADDSKDNKVEEIKKDTVKDEYVEGAFYVTESGSKYHTFNCRYVQKSRIVKTRQDILNSNYDACSVCGVENIKESTVESQEASSNQNNEVTVYITKSGKKYHENGCSSLSRSKISISLEDAINRGYGACKRCH